MKKVDVFFKGFVMRCVAKDDQKYTYTFGYIDVGKPLFYNCSQEFGWLNYWPEIISLPLNPKSEVGLHASLSSPSPTVPQKSLKWLNPVEKK